MKTPYKLSQLLMGSFVLLLLIAGCKIHIVHQYPDGVPNSNANYLDRVLSTQDLGVGYDLVHTDPEDWALNSVQATRVRPKLFVYESDTDPNRFIDIPQLEGPSVRRILPKGVFAETNSRFQWSDEMRFVYSATDFQESYGGSVSASVGVPVAAFSASASYEETRASTSVEQSSFAFKDGAFRGHRLEMDPTYSHQLNPKFRLAVAELTADNADDFIQLWGTHYSYAVTIGARCAYKMEYGSKERTRMNGQGGGFELAVSGGTGVVEVGVGASYSQSSMQSAKDASGAKSIDFVSYGGSGAGIDDFALWTKHAVNNPTVVDVNLDSITGLLNRSYFPKDDSIDQKRALLVAAIQSYFATAAGNMKLVKSSKNFNYQAPPAKFEFRIMYISHSMRSGAEKDISYWGKLFAKPYDGDLVEYGPLKIGLGPKPTSEEKQAKIWNERAEDFLNRPIFYAPRYLSDTIQFSPMDKADKGKWASLIGDIVAWKPYETKAQVPFAKRGQIIETDFLGEVFSTTPIVFYVAWQDVATGFISLTGEVEEYWKGHSGLKTKVDIDNRIPFAEVEVGEEVHKTVQFIMDDNDMVNVPIITVEMRLKRIE
ncbi:MAG: MAC/perforin domain-containing protein [Bacteroidia bacterium]